MTPTIKRLLILSAGALLFACADMGYRVQTGSRAAIRRRGPSKPTAAAARIIWRASSTVPAPIMRKRCAPCPVT
jgi:hypothetical protein